MEHITGIFPAARVVVRTQACRSQSGNIREKAWKNVSKMPGHAVITQLLTLVCAGAAGEEGTCGAG